MRITLVHNPASGHDQPSPEQLCQLLQRAGHQIDYHDAREAGHLRDDELRGDVVLAAGGDGTVRRLARRLAGGLVPLAILPLGTANNVATSLGIEGPPDELVHGLSGGDCRSIDVGVLQGPSGEEIFLEAVGVGPFARAADLLSQRTDPSGRHEELEQDLRMLRAAVDAYPVHRCSVSIDGEISDGEFLWIEVMNMPRLGPGLPLAPDADPSDGLLDVVQARESDRGTFARFLGDRLRGCDVAPPFLLQRGRVVRLEVSGGTMHLDDESRKIEPGTVLHLTVRRGAVRMLIPGRRGIH